MIGNTPTFIANGNDFENASGAHLYCLGGTVPDANLSGNYWQNGVTSPVPACLTSANTANAAATPLSGAGPLTVNGAALAGSDDTGTTRARPAAPGRCVGL
jgi:hypothetical protein